MRLIKSILGMGQSIAYAICRGCGQVVSSVLNWFNPIYVEHWRDGKMIGKYRMCNGVTTVGKNYLLDAGFHGSSPVTDWYIGLIDNASFSALSAADTMGSHAGWIESTIYSESTRVNWTEGASSAGSITNASPLTFTINGTGTINGIFVTSNSAKSSTTGTLWATGSFPTAVPVVAADVFKITYTISA